MNKINMKTILFCVGIVFFVNFQSLFAVKIISVEEDPIQDEQAEEISGLQSIQQEQIGEQLEEIERQEGEILEQTRQEELRLKILVDSRKESMLPGGDEIIYDGASLEVENIALSSQPNSLLRKQSKKLTLSRYDYSPPEPLVASRSFKKINQRTSGPSQWGEFSCCRRVTGVQTRERMINPRSIQVQPRECSWDYCEECVDALPLCDALRDVQKACEQESHYRGFMSRNCPAACGWCDEPTTTVRPKTKPTTRSPTSATTPRSNRDPNLRRVRVFMKATTPAYTYKFTTSRARPRHPWKTLARSVNPGEVAAFFLYSRPTERFQMPIYFCKAGRTLAGHKSHVSRRPCSGAWKTDVVLFASNVSLPNTRRLFVANRGRAPWTSRIFRNSRACCGYEKSKWKFYAPIIQRPRNPIKPTNSPKRPTETPSTASPGTKSPQTSSKTPSDFDRECLQYHNFFRAAHGVPLLKWDPALTATAQKWANYLADHAPEHPFRTGPDFKRTSNWPHSQRNTQYRGRGVGENIAWDFSPSGSPARESVLRWYAEIFDHDRSKPTFSAPGKPIGHYTQMLWKDSDYVGCAVAVRNIKKGPFTYQSTYAVAHYAPSGNIHYSRKSQTHAAYTRNVPPPARGTCMSPEMCSMHNKEINRCMGFSENMSCGCSRRNAGVFGGRPRCKGSGGCVVSCKRPPTVDGPLNYSWTKECQGETSCECIYTPRKGRAGATCS